MVFAGYYQPKVVNVAHSPERLGGSGQKGPVYAMSVCLLVPSMLYQYGVKDAGVLRWLKLPTPHACGCTTSYVACTQSCLTLTGRPGSCGSMSVVA